MLYYDIMISTDGIMLTTKGSNVPGVIFYAFYQDEIKRDLFLKLSGIDIPLEKEESFTFNNFVMGEGTKEILDFFTIINLTEEEKLKRLVKQYLHEDMSREQFEQEIVPYRMAEKLSK